MHPTTGQELTSAVEEPWQDLVTCRDEEILFGVIAPVLHGCFCWLAVTAWSLLDLPGSPGSPPAFTRHMSSGPALQQGIAGWLAGWLAGC